MAPVRRAAGHSRVTPSREIERQRRRQGHGCWDHLIAAPLWPKYGENLGTLLRTCDAVGACMAVPKRTWVPDALAKGNTLRRPACVHWTGADPLVWLERQKRRDGTRIIGVELADEAVRLGDLPAARTRTTGWPASCKHSVATDRRANILFN